MEENPRYYIPKVNVTYFFSLTLVDKGQRVPALGLTNSP